ncbi:LysR family transcriptional regulator [Rosenbergiella epipactidis]|uniref:LysR family transcriptional regulator n=1 Tax=Rosenbergiella epipactidis TaxID=1544694 RepID=UPI00202708FB|nr:LysR family transcriptional regulator [Rosenbergiella epipactidis]
MNLFLSMSVFVKIVEIGSLNGAAIKLGLSPTMVGKHLKLLESNLKTQLLNRTTRRIHLTPSGVEYYHHCRKILELIDEGKERLKNDQLTPSGQITLSCPEIFGNKKILPFSLKYMERFPETQIHISLTDRLVDIIREDVDIAIRIGEPPDSSEIIARPLARYELVACASPAYLEKYGTPEKPEDLFNHQCISLNESVLDQWQPPNFKNNIRNSRLTSDSSAVIRQGAISGMGIIIQAKLSVEDAIDTGLLIPILGHYPLPNRKVNALYARKKHTPARVKFLLDALQESFPHEN